MNTIAVMPVLPDTFMLSDGELKAIQLQAARSVGLGDIRLHDRLSNGTEGPELVVIPPGIFEYGAGPGETASDTERPRRTAVIERAFAIAVDPVTTQAFEAYARAVGWTPREELMWLTGRMPVINVRQTDALDYCAWLSRETGQRYRLPTEREWEYACRAGAATPYPYGDTITLEDVVYHPDKDSCVSREKKPRQLSIRMASCGAKEIGQRRPNRWGLRDMIGNVWEFTASPWTPDHDSAPELRQPGNPQPVVTKGGSWFDGPDCCRSAARFRRLENELDINLGFRVLREL